ncbi:Hsp20/alpha crystallin family protein [Streptomyces sp. NBC_00286]|uniref:Hsp20/alpha crystallin family protein n=1 Tax=Streptomyces sp. NBC_00286 TaxID=2975701 RepID=UPI002E287D85|nr:Hsp20/alpha crystallin family protein [Streptomyces sp. NBC_00286]
MLLRTDPFRELDRLAEQLLGTVARPVTMPMDAYEREGAFWVHLDLPGIDPDSIDLSVEQNVLTVRAERAAPDVAQSELVVAERPYGVFRRELFLGETLDVEHVEASYDAGVLTVKIPVAEQAKPRKIEISHAEEKKELSG